MADAQNIAYCVYTSCLCINICNIMEVFLRDLSTQVMSIRDIVIKHSFKYLIRYPQSSIGPSMMKVGMQLLQDNHSSHINKSYSAD